VADRAGWLEAVESELRAAGRELQVPPPAVDVAAAVRRRLAGRALGRRRALNPGTWVRRRRLGWRAVAVTVAALLAVVIATPQGRAVISHAFRFAGVELRQGQQGSGPVRSPGGTPSLPGERQRTLAEARRQAAFPILVPAALGLPDEVTVSDGGRAVSLTYRRAPYGLVRIDEFAGYLDQVVFEKLVSFGDVTQVAVNGARGLWIKGPHDLIYITRGGTPATATTRLTTGNTLIWSTGRVALRLEGNLGLDAALAIADSAR
jgi:hypothetical protein